MLSARRPSARLEFLTHETGDPSPRRFQAAVDIGLVAVSVIVTWTGKRLASNR